MQIKVIIIGIAAFIVLGIAGFNLWYKSIIITEKDAMSDLPEITLPKEEIDFTERYAARVDRVDVLFEQKDYTTYRLTTNGLVREGELNTERGFGDDPDATVYVLNWRKPEGEQIYYVRLTSDPTHIYVLDGNREMIKGSALTLL